MLLAIRVFTDVVILDVKINSVAQQNCCPERLIQFRISLQWGWSQSSNLFQTISIVDLVSCLLFDWSKLYKAPVL